MSYPEPDQPHAHSTPSRREREGFAVAGATARAAIERAIGSGAIKSRRARVLLAVLYLTVCYSRVGDRVYVAQIAAIAQIPGDVDERHTRRELANLHREGVIEWAGQRGRGRQSFVSLALSEKTRPLLAPILGGKTGPIRDGKPGQSEHENRASSGPPTEKTFREDAEEDDVVISDDLKALLHRVDTAAINKGGGPLLGEQRDRARAAYAESRQGVEHLARVAIGTDRPAAMFDHYVKAGAHRTAGAPGPSPTERAEALIRQRYFPADDVEGWLVERGVPEPDWPHLLALAHGSGTEAAA